MPEKEACLAYIHVYHSPHESLLILRQHVLVSDHEVLRAHPQWSHFRRLRLNGWSRLRHSHGLPVACLPFKT